MPDPIHNFIEGRWVPSTGTDTLPVEDPASRETLAEVPLSGSADVQAAVAAAKAAFPDWRDTPAVERARVLFRLKILLDEHHEELARSLTTEHGKIIAETRGEVRRGIENVEHACGIPSLMMGDSLENIARGVDCASWRQPLGVFGVVTPYNFPVMIPLWFWPYAVATGNCVVLKPSEQDPLTHQRIVDLATAAGLPPGVLNVVHGDRAAVDALIEHPDVVGISFVGSSRVAEDVYTRAAARGKRVQALGGAKNHMIVMPDADMELMTEASLASLFGSTGQRCLAGSIMVGVRGAYAEMKKRLVQGAGSWTVGHGLDESVHMGPVVSGSHRERIEAYIQSGEDEGAALVMDGRSPRVADHPEGHFVAPTIFEGVSPEMVIGSEEIFGPVAGLVEVDSIDAAVALLERSSFGNATTIFTNDGGAAREFRYRAGISMIGVNIGVAAPMAMFPFGGSRGSFYGDLKAQGRDAVAFFTDQRVVISRWSRQ